VEEEAHVLEKPLLFLEKEVRSLLSRVGEKNGEALKLDRSQRQKRQ
jgi:hypothetical protein